MKRAVLVCVTAFLCGVAGGCDDVESGRDYECQVHSDCLGERLCLDGACVNAFDRWYILDNIEATVVSSDAGWDPLGGAPDLFVCARVDDVVIGCTGVATNKFSFAYADSWEFRPSAGSTLLIALLDDDDVSDPEVIAACEGEITLDELRSDGVPLYCESQMGDHFEFSISAR